MAEADPEQGGEDRRIYDACAPELFQRLRRGFGYTVRGGERRFLRITSRFEQEEVVQETFCRFLTQRQRGTFDPSQDPEPYVMRIGYYTALRGAAEPRDPGRGGPFQGGRPGARPRGRERGAPA